MTITEKEFTKIERAIQNCDYDLDGWFPSIDDLDRFVYPNKEKYFVFILFLLEKSKTMSLTSEQQEARKELQKIAYELEIKEGDGP